MTETQVFVRNMIFLKLRFIIFVFHFAAYFVYRFLDNERSYFSEQGVSRILFILYLIGRECVIVKYNWFAQHFGEKRKSLPASKYDFLIPFCGTFLK